MMRLLVSAVMVLAVVVGVKTAHAGPDWKCQKERVDAAAKYDACHHKVLGKYDGGLVDDQKVRDFLQKCRVKYVSTWAKLQSKHTAGICDQARFADNGDATVTDWLTGLQWEKKTVGAGVHYYDDVRTMSSIGSPNDNGTAFTLFLNGLNDPASCFAGHCDWRLPTLAELETLLVEPCGTPPCIPSVLGPVGEARDAEYWTTTPSQDPLKAWTVDFDPIPYTWWYHLVRSNNLHVRAVRGGL